MARVTIIKKRSVVRICKVVEEDRFVLGLVYSPEETDSQGDITNAEEIKKACWGFLAEGGGFNIMHKGEDRDVQVVENFRAPINFVLKNVDGDTRKVKKGSWLIGCLIGESEGDLWDAIKKGTFKGFSMEGEAHAVAV